jgi:hypothetical protein
MWTYWGWLEISLLALDEQARRRGFGKTLAAILSREGSWCTAGWLLGR